MRKQEIKVKQEIKFHYEGFEYTVTPFLDGSDGQWAPHGTIKFFSPKVKEFIASFRIHTTPGSVAGIRTSVDAYTVQPVTGGGIRKDTQHKLALQAQKAVDSVPGIFEEILLQNNKVAALVEEQRAQREAEAKVSAAASRTEVLAWWLKTIKKFKGVDYALDPVQTLIGINRCFVTKEAVKEFFTKELSPDVLSAKASKAEDEIRRLTRIAESLNALLCTMGTFNDEDFEDYWACVEEEIANEKAKNNGQ